MTGARKMDKAEKRLEAILERLYITAQAKKGKTVYRTAGRVNPITGSAWNGLTDEEKENFFQNGCPKRAQVFDL